MEDDEFNKPQLPSVPSNLAPNTIKLSDLLDFAVQQVFHEITVLSELLPKKRDDEKKVSLVQFAHNTRMLYVKLLALVKWVKSSKKFEQCTAISYFLDQQQELLLDSANQLYRIRETMTSCRLPPFQIAEAVDTLTLGTYNRIPMCIKDAFIKKPPLKPGEQAAVLRRLNQIIHTRISKESSKLSPRIKEIRIRNGHLTLVVPGEFEVQASILSEKSEMPWTLLNIKMLVEDYEIGYGSQLVHPLQLNRIHNHLQEKLNRWQAEEGESPIANTYKFLHRFAQSLQLDIIFCQASQLAGNQGQYASKMLIERYDPQERVLTLGYWLKKIILRPGSSQFRITSEYRVTILGTDDDGPLKVVHSPAYPGLGTLDDRSGRLSVDRLLSETLVVRAKERLLRIRKRIEATETNMPIALLGQAVPYLKMPLLEDSVTNPHECLSISINLYSGKVLCDLAALNNRDKTELRELERSIYDDYKPIDVLKKQLEKFKIHLMIERFKRSITSMQVRVVNEAEMAPFFKKLRSIPLDRICLQFTKEESYFVIVTFETAKHLTLKLSIHLLIVIEDRCQLIELSEVEHVFDTLKRVISLESLGPDAKFLVGDASKRVFTPLEKQLIYAIATVDDRLGFMRVKQELDKKGISTNLKEEPQIRGLILTITDFSQIPDIKSVGFADHLLRCVIRLDNRTKGTWQLECTMKNPPVWRPRKYNDKQPDRFSCITDLKGSGSSESIAPVVIDRLVTYANIYEIVERFSKAYNTYYKNYCEVLAFTYHKLVLAYGSSRDMLLFVTFQHGRSPETPFKLAFGCTHAKTPDGGLPMYENRKWNPHAMMGLELTRRFNKNNDLVDLVNYLLMTSEPLYYVYNFIKSRFVSIKPYCAAMGLDASFPLTNKGQISVLNRTTLRASFGDMHLEIALLMDNKTAIRDASRDKAKVAGLYDFFKFYDPETQILGEEPVQSISQSGYNSIPNPQSVGNMLQVPTPGWMDNNSPKMEPRSPMESDTRLQTTRRVIIVNHMCLATTLGWKPDAIKPNVFHCLFDSYLSDLWFLERVTNIFEQYKHGNGDSKLCNGLAIFAFTKDADHVKIRFPSLGVEVSTVQFKLFMDPETFNLSVEIVYGEDGPPPDVVSLLEQYCIEKVVKVKNEISLCSFVMLLRLLPFKGVESLAPYLIKQIETADKPTRLCFVMSYVLRPAQNTPNTQRLSPGIIVNDANSITFSIVFTHNTTHHKNCLITYFVDSNSIRIGTPNQQAASQSDEMAIRTTVEVNKEAENTKLCAVYLFVKHMWDQYQVINYPVNPALPF